MSWGYGYWPKSKTVAERRADAEKAIAKGGKKGEAFAPVTVDGRKIARTFWGDAWCKNLERYQDFAHRLDRGRSYVRSGSVIHLAIAAGRVEARVVGSRATPYKVEIKISAVAAPAWSAIQRDCGGSIGSLVDLLAGTLSEAVMARLCAEGTGLFPAPMAIKFTCSCPDYASMCKHVAATMYGVGARLDAKPELLFTLRQVTAEELLASATRALPGGKAPRSKRILGGDGLSALFGIELADAPAPDAKPPRARTAKPPPAPPKKSPAPPKRSPAPPSKKSPAPPKKSRARRP